MKIRSLLLITALGFGITAASRTAALAQVDIEGTTYWSAAAQTCVPGRGPIQDDSYALWWNYVSWYGTNLDNMAFWCQVQPNDGGDNPNRLYLTALDNTGTATDTYVKADLEVRGYLPVYRGCDDRLYGRDRC